jgi:hypothetical protein
VHLDTSERQYYKTINNNPNEEEVAGAHSEGYSSSLRHQCGYVTSNSDLLHMQYLREKPLLEEIRQLRLAKEETDRRLA